MFLNERTDLQLCTVLNYTSRGKVSDVRGRPYHALSYRLSGSSDFSDSQRRITAKAGQIFYMPADTAYRHYSGNDQVIVLHFYMSGAPKSPFEVFDPGEKELFRDAFVSLSRIWQEKQPGYYFNAMSVFYKLLHQMQLHFSPDLAGLTYSKIRPALRYIHEHLDDCRLSVPTLCQLLGVSDTYFRELFYEVFTMTPLQYINIQRIERACDLLASEQLRIEEIAYRCGFSDPKYFSTVFKKHKGCSPSKYNK